MQALTPVFGASAKEKDMDVQRTIEYYARLTDDDLCQCATCRNYMLRIKAAYQEVAEYLQTMGIDIEKPFEAMPLPPHPAGTIEYSGVQYIVMGTDAGFEPSAVGGVNIEMAESSPYTDIDEDHFVIELSPITLKWEA